MLSPTDSQAVRLLNDSAIAADGESALNEAAVLALTEDSDGVVHHLERRGNVLWGYAQADRRLGTAQIVVAPAHRRQGVGSTLVARLGGLDLWAFGDQEAARGFAAHHGYRVRRRLLVLELAPIPDQSADPRPSGPPAIRAFNADTDTQGLLEVNAAAFDWHPEQRHFSRADLDARRAADWFDPAGLLVAVDAQGVAGFHWTKKHPDGRGEVYILATHPRAQGTGLGKRLLRAGLNHLAASGCLSVHLYVEESNSRAVELYERAGFRRVHSDVLYGPGGSADQEAHR